MKNITFKWNSAKEKMPDDNERVLVYSPYYDNGI
jgi:hypothetical protein